MTPIVSPSFARNRALNREVLKGSAVNKYDGRSTSRRIERDRRLLEGKARAAADRARQRQK